MNIPTPAWIDHLSLPSPTELWRRLPPQYRLWPEKQRFSREDVRENLDLLLFVGWAVVFRCMSGQNRKQSTQSTRNRTEDHIVKAWWNRPSALYLTLALCHPVVQKCFWPWLDARASFHIPVRDILASLDTFYFWGSAVWYRFLWKSPTLHQPPSPPPGTSPKDESDYQQRRAMNFKDPSLYAFIEECQEAKRNLRPKKDPAMHRLKKLQEIRRAQNSQGDGFLNLTPGKLQTLRNSLQQTERSPAAQ